jgi:hypothetical protein
MILAPQIDPYRNEATGPTAFMTERNEQEVRCGICARPLYVSDETYRSFTEAVETGLEHPFLCEVCSELEA